MKNDTLQGLNDLSCAYMAKQVQRSRMTFYQLELSTSVREATQLDNKSLISVLAHLLVFASLPIVLAM